MYDDGMAGGGMIPKAWRWDDMGRVIDWIHLARYALAFSSSSSCFFFLNIPDSIERNITMSISSFF